MCDVLDRIEAKGIAIGKELKAAKMAVSLNEQGVPISVIAKAADKPIEVIEKWVGLSSD